MKAIVNTQNELVIDLGSAKARTKAQAFAVRELLKTGRLVELINYMQTFNSTRKRQYDLPRHKTRANLAAKVDRLASKKPNTVGLMFERMLDYTSQHTPRTVHKTYVGVEIECMVPKSAFEDVIEATTEACQHCDGMGVFIIQAEETDEDGDVIREEETETCHYCDGEGTRTRGGNREEEGFHSALGELLRSKRIKWVTVKHDGSIDAEDGYFAVEITVLTRLDDPKNLKLVCEALASIQAKVNKSCGMHVHLDARHLNRDQVTAIGENFRKALPVMLAMVPTTRRTNSYCRPCVSAINGDRYAAVNMTAFNKFRTIEVRLHSSTTDFDKIISWCKFTSAIMQAPAIRGVCNDLMELTEFINIDETLVEYITQRTALFSPEPATCTSSEAQDNDSIGTAV